MIEKQTIENLANLARLEISEEKKDKLRKDISEVLEYIEKLNEVNTSQVDFKAISPVVNQVREDKVKDTPKSQKENMRSMGKSKDDYFQVESV